MKMAGPSPVPHQDSFNAPSPDSLDYDGTDEERKAIQLDRRYSPRKIGTSVSAMVHSDTNYILITNSNRRRQRPQRYSEREFVEGVSENEADSDNDDDIVGEVVYNEEYLQKRKERRKFSSSSEGDEEYHLDGENAEDEEEEEDEDEEGDDSFSASDDSDQPQKFKKLPGRTRRETKLRSVGELQSGLRRSKRATRNCIDYRQLELSESEPESSKPAKSNGSDKHSDASDDPGFSMGSEDTEGNEDNQEMKIDQPVEEQPEIIKEEQNQPPTKMNSPEQDEFEGGAHKRRFLDLNELAPGSGFEDGPMMKDDDTDDF